MLDSYVLAQLDPNAFEHLVNALALRVLGAGSTGFGPGADGGRDGYYEGEAPYPSSVERWSGRWYIQSKFHKPHLSADPQKWLLDRIEEELSAFTKPGSQRTWPDVWIIATNIDPSGVPMTGAFDRAKTIVEAARPELTSRFHIWGGAKVISLLIEHSDIAAAYGHFLTPGNIIAELYQQLNDSRTELEAVLHHLVLRGLREHQHTKLEQAGSAADTRPGLQRLFVDLPYHCKDLDISGMALADLTLAVAQNHRPSTLGFEKESKIWRRWARVPRRSRVWFLKGGPGQGKSTLGQYLCQIHRAALLLQPDGIPAISRDFELAQEIHDRADAHGFWPVVPRIPITIELKDYAFWFGRRTDSQGRGILTFLAERISVAAEQDITTRGLRRALGTRSWIVVFDGLDEVPHAVKDLVANEVIHFVNGIAVETDADLLAICTSRPQGYSGQFADLDAPVTDLKELSAQQALACAKPVVTFDRAEAEATAAMQTLAAAVATHSIRELMKTPLQAHIMAIIVRDGGRPPERRWQLFTTFYHVIRRREANRNLPNEDLARLLREDEQLIKTVHNRLGFVLHARAETTEGAQTTLNRSEFKSLIDQAISQLVDEGEDALATTLMEATQERLVLVSTPDDGDHLRFDVRQLQEFFAAEFLFESINAETLRIRLQSIASDAHWREVMHFILSALVENGRRTELAVALQVIKALDDDGESPPERVLRRRLAIGAILAARLIQEGVLEQDKRYRQDFRPLITPLGGLSSSRELEALATDQPKTRRWLIRVALECISEGAPAEVTGWFSVLARIVPDSDNNIQEVIDVFRAVSGSQLGAILFSFEQELYYTPSSRKPISSWFSAVIVERLLSPCWYELGERGIRNALSLLRIAINDDLLREMSLPDTERLLLLELLSSADQTQGKKWEKIGILHVAQHANTWRTEPYEVLPFSGAAITEPVAGILELVRLASRFASERTLGSLQSFAEYLEDKTWALHMLPDVLASQIPLDDSADLSTQIQRILGLTAEDFATLMASGTVGDFRPRIPLHTMRYAEYESEDFLVTCREHPEVALQLLVDWDIYSGEDAPEWRNSTELMETLVQSLLSRLELPNIQLPAFGFLFRSNEIKEAEALRSAVLYFAEKRSPVIYGNVGPYAFPIRLPDETALIPHAIYTTIANERFLFSYYDDDLQFLSDDLVRTASVASQISIYFPSVERLFDVHDTAERGSFLRSCAAVALLLHPDNGAALSEIWDDLLEGYRGGARWYVILLVSLLDLVSGPGDQFGRYALGSLIHVTRDDFGVHDVVEKLLSIWREHSFSPVQSAGLIDEWLSGRA